MSYVRSLGSAQSRPRSRARVALGATVVEYGVVATQATQKPPPPKPRRTQAIAVPGTARGIATLGSTQSRPRSRLRVMGTLGDDSLSTEEAWRGQVLEAVRTTAHWQEQWVKRDELQRWIQIGATVSIPLFAAIWRGIFHWRNKTTL